MLLIQELLQLQENMINEDLGALKVIDKKFRKALMLGSEYRIDKAKVKAAAAQGKTLDGWDKKVGRNIIKGGLGENSKSEEHTVKTDKELIALINNPKYGAVLMHNGVHQYAIFTAGKWPQDDNKWKTVTKRALGIDFGVLDEVHPSFNDITDADRSSGMTGPSGTKIRPGKLYKLGFGHISDVKIYDSSDAATMSVKIATYIMTLLKGVKINAQVTCFTIDESGKEKATARENARKDSVPDLRNDSVRKEYEKQIRSVFKGKLDKYKSDKSVKVSTPEEALKAIVDKGYLDKITINGITYDYADDRINFRVMRRPSTSSTGYSGDASYITYKINSSTPEYKKMAVERDEMREQFKEANKAAGQEKPFEFSAEQEKQLDSLRPAAEFKLMLRLEGAKIVPYEIVFERGFLW